MWEGLVSQHPPSIVAPEFLNFFNIISVFDVKLNWLIPDVIGNLLVKMLARLLPVWSAAEIVWSQKVPFEMRESIFGVYDVLFSPNVLSALKASIVKKRIF